MTLPPPVVLVPSRYTEWVALAAEMAAGVRRLVPGVQIEHIGSTSVPDLAAKDVVDLLVGVSADGIARTAQDLAAAGWDLEGGLPGHSWLSYPSRAERKYVLHVVEYKGRPWERRIAFRDLLRADGAARARYADAKLAASKKAAGWDDYTQSKTPVVTELLAGLARNHPAAGG